VKGRMSRKMRNRGRWIGRQRRKIKKSWRETMKSRRIRLRRKTEKENWRS
jgi:hypothetical protein